MPTYRTTIPVLAFTDLADFTAGNTGRTRFHDALIALAARPLGLPAVVLAYEEVAAAGSAVFGAVVAAVVAVVVGGGGEGEREGEKEEEDEVEG